RDHLSRFAPFDELPEETLDDIARQTQVRYFKAGSPILDKDAPLNELHYIRSGAVEIYRPNGELFNRLGEGDIFGQAGLRRNRRVRSPARALEDSLIYFIPGELFFRLCDEHDSFADFVDTEGAARLRSAVQSQGRASELSKVRVNRLIRRPPYILNAQASIHRAAAVMTEQSVSALLITEPDPQQPELQRVSGIITDRDFRTRVVSAALPPETPLHSIMTPEPITLQANASVLDAILCMLRHNIHHLPILSRRRPVGLINLADVIRYQSQNSLYLVNDIFNRQS